jgi:hypothetical protein
MLEIPQTKLPEELGTQESNFEKAHPNQYRQAERQRADHTRSCPHE